MAPNPCHYHGDVDSKHYHTWGAHVVAISISGQCIQPSLRVLNLSGLIFVVLEVDLTFNSISTVLTCILVSHQYPLRASNLICPLREKATKKQVLFLVVRLEGIFAVGESNGTVFRNPPCQLTSSRSGGCSSLQCNCLHIHLRGCRG